MVYMDADTFARLDLRPKIAHDGPTGALFDHEELPARYAGALFEKASDISTYFDPRSHNPGISSSISDVTTVAYFLSRATALRLCLIADEALMFEDAVVVAIQGTATTLIIDNVCALRSEDELPKSKVAAFFAGEFFNKRILMIEGSSRKTERTSHAR